MVTTEKSPLFTVINADESESISGGCTIKRGGDKMKNCSAEQIEAYFKHQK